MTSQRERIYTRKLRAEFGAKDMSLDTVKNCLKNGADPKEAMRGVSATYRSRKTMLNLIDQYKK